MYMPGRRRKPVAALSRRLALHLPIARLAWGFAVFAIVASAAHADSARFDLAGPKVEVRVTRAGTTLPIASVPNLQPGDRLWLHPDLPATQSVRYLMVLAFLRGTTNPPPDNWFFRIETWDKKVSDEGVEITVPKEAQQAVVFLAPVTGGDFTTLRSAVQGRPGVFVRASQDLTAAGFEQARIEKYIAAMRQLSPAEQADPKQLQQQSERIAATLALKPNDDCMKFPPEQEFTCLTQSGNQTLLDDGHGQSIIEALSGDTASGLLSNASETQLAGGGVYSAYLGTVLDLVHLMGSLHVAQYQYIPAIAFPQQQSLNLRLDTPPSFHNPKSVIVIGLPSVQQTTPPPLRAADAKQVSCLAKPGVVLPVEGAPLVFSTGFAHDLVLHLNYPAGAKPNPSQPQDLPLAADAFHGGLVLAPIPKRRTLPATAVKASPPASPAADPADTEPTAHAAKPSPPASSSIDPAELTGTVQGSWGFGSFTGPTLPLQDAPGEDWKLAADDPLIAGKNQHLVLTSTGSACVQNIALEPAPAKPEKVTWKSADGPDDKPNSIEVTLDRPAQSSGPLHLAIHQYGDPKPATVSLVSYSEPAKLIGIEFHAGDTTAVLMGSFLEQVQHVKFAGATFDPQKSAMIQPDADAAPAGPKESLPLAITAGAKPPALPAGDKLTAQVALKDGRTLPLEFTVAPARPSVTIISRADVRPDDAAKTQWPIKLASQSDLPVGDSLLFSLKSAQRFPRTGTLEVASADDSLHTALSVANNSLILEDPQAVLATLQPLKAFGDSAFGPIRLRAVAPDGSAGEWLPLVTLVRLPTISGLSCPVAAAAPQPSTSTLATSAAPAAGSVTPAPASTESKATPASPAPNSAPVTPGEADTAAPQGPPKAAPPAAPSQTATSAAPPAATPPASCTLTGAGLYFIDSISTDESFTNPVRVPEGFVGSSLTAPPPTGAEYYLRLRDDPTAIDTLTLPAGPL
jgi:hypothetical protein